MQKQISGFSKLTKEEKIEWLTNPFTNKKEGVKTLKKYWNTNKKLQELHDGFIENTISNFYFPYAIAPNFFINGKNYTIPMVIEESSVVAAASLVAKFWSTRGGFKTTVIGTTKIGQVHFMFAGSFSDLKNYFNAIKFELFIVTESITKNMRKRGGGILDIKLRNKTIDLKNYYQLHVTFETKDSMGANFINSCLEAIANKFKKEDINIIMSILSNYVPDCLVRAEVSCKVEDLYKENAKHYAQNFVNALNIANAEPHRAVTHNKGIMNGIDSVVIATGNDFRAVEAGVHAYASRTGKYKSLSNAKIKDGVFSFWLEIPLALGTVGGLTKLHPLAKLSLEILDHPTAKELMQIVVCVGLAQNFAALRALTTTGIQEGHMKMHLSNIIKQLDVNKKEAQHLLNFFKNKTVSYSEVITEFERNR
ncbi:MAG: hydroxymethylglutaryl-CoA reductase, degradative [Flavobacteriaceae bacterium]|nr:hydroxymethylglutaryl-CoA reductase, degradative [Flavobacteriaceae bacterium]